MDRIQKKIHKVIIYYRDDMFLFKPEDAIEVIKECQRLGIKISDIEGLILFPNGGIQPQMEHSLTLKDNNTHWKEAIDFIFSRLKVNSNLLFEIFYDEY